MVFIEDTMMLTEAERRELERRKGRADEARRARCILLFAVERLAGLYSRHCGQPAMVLTPQLEARLLDLTRRGPQDGSTHWSMRRWGKNVGVS